MNEGYFNGIRIDQRSLMEYIRFLKKLRTELVNNNDIMKNKYKSTSGWVDDGYRILGDKLNSLNPNINILIETITKTIRNLEELYRRIDDYLMLVKKHRR
ncbi:MAG: hypothetical protein K5765_08325 [Clostridia bacterium]|nr:hypothetical protein [Clostridia bacterium]